MGNLAAIPIRRLDHVKLTDKQIVGSVGQIAVLTARIVTEGRPETRGIIIQGEGQPPYLLTTYEDDNATNLAWSTHAIACLAFNALHAGSLMHDLLMSPVGYTDGAA